MQAIALALDRPRHKERRMAEQPADVNCRPDPIVQAAAAVAFDPVHPEAPAALSLAPKQARTHRAFVEIEVAVRQVTAGTRPAVS